MNMFSVLAYCIQRLYIVHCSSEFFKMVVYILLHMQCLHCLSITLYIYIIYKIHYSIYPFICILKSYTFCFIVNDFIVFYTFSLITKQLENFDTFACLMHKDLYESQRICISHQSWNGTYDFRNWREKCIILRTNFGIVTQEGVYRCIKQLDEALC